MEYLLVHRGARGASFVFELLYGGEGAQGVTMPMPIPDIIDVKWTTEADGQVHEAHVPLKSKVSAEDVSGKIVSIELDGSLLKVFLIKRLPSFEEERKQVY